MIRPFRCVALLARAPGVRVLREALLREPGLEVAAVATHARLPRSESPERGPRPELEELEDLCRGAGVPLVTVDRARDGRHPAVLDEPCDVIVSVSWRYVLEAAALGQARVGTINLHRGRLPGYEGAAPVRRMLADRVGSAEITAHEMVEEVDAGPVLATARLPAAVGPGEDLDAATERVKAELLPLYAPLCTLALRVLRARGVGDG